MSATPLPGQWAVVSHGPGEVALVAQVVPGASGAVNLDRSPFRVLPTNLAGAFDDQGAAWALCHGINAANVRHTVGMERARLNANAEWRADVGRLLL